MLGLLAVRLALRALGLRRGVRHESEAQLFTNPSFSIGVRDYLQAPGVLRPWLGSIARRLVLRESADARRRDLAESDHRTFVLRVDGAIDQTTLRNLLIWQNHVLSCYPASSEGRSVDVMLMLMQPSGDEPRLFDLISAALMLERIRSLSVFWGAESLQSAVPLFMSNAEQARWSDTKHADDLRRLPAEMTEQVERHGTSGGVKLLPDGRKRAQDFFKAALPGQFIVAVGLREDEEGAIHPADLGIWLSLLDAAAARHSHVAFVVLNRLAPSQWRTWPPHIRFARHQGLSLQDALCLAQIADGYVGALDIFGLAANAASRPGVYVPLTDAGMPPRDQDQSGQTSGQERSGQEQSGQEQSVKASRQIMVGSHDRGRIEAALERFLSRLPRCSVGAFHGR